MWPVVVNLWGIKVSWFGLSLAIGCLWASFVVWQKMREDYEEESILSLTIWLAVMAWLGSGVWIWWGNFRTVWGSLVATVLGLGWWCRKYKWSFWEWMDVVLWVSLGVGALGGIGWGPEGLVSAGLAAVGLILGNWMWRNYRMISWYKSGRPGFVGLFAWGWWAIVVAIGQRGGVYWAGLSVTQWVALWVLIMAVVAIYLRGDRKITGDLKSIWQKLIKRRTRE